MASGKMYKTLPHFFALARTVSEILPIEIWDLQKVGQGHVVHFSQLHHWMANVKNLQKSPRQFCSSSHRFRDIYTYNILHSKSRSRSRRTIFALTLFDGKYKNLQKTRNFCAWSYRFRAINIFYLLPSKVGKGHGVQLSQWRHSMATVKIYKRWFLHFWFSPRYELCSLL